MSEEQILAELCVDNIRAHVKHIAETMPSRLAGTPNAARVAAYSDQQIKAAGLPAEWKEWGSGFIKTDDWVETIYNSLTKKMPDHPVNTKHH